MNIISKLIPAIVILLLPLSVSAFRIPDTGQESCYQTGVPEPCPAVGEAFYGLDGNYAVNPPSYTKLAADGTALDPAASAWSAIQDNVTDLIWETKTDDGSIHDKDNLYSWITAASHIHHLNITHYGGFNDWRLPTIRELESLQFFTSSRPSIDNNFFPNTVYREDISPYETIYYMSESPAPIIPENILSFQYNGAPYYHTKEQTRVDLMALRAVRGQKQTLSNNLLDNGDGTITDTTTGLMWLKQALDEDQDGTGDKHSWQDALAQCAALEEAGYTDWRMPTIKELRSLFIYAGTYPYLDPVLSETDPYFYSSTTLVGSEGNAPYIWEQGWAPGSYQSFDHFSGPSSVQLITDPLYHRLTRPVRGGQRIAPDKLIITNPRQTDEIFVGETVTVTWEHRELGGDISLNLLSQAGPTNSFTTEITASTPNNGSFDFIVPDTPTHGAVLAIAHLTEPDQTNHESFFSISQAAYLDIYSIYDSSSNSHQLTLRAANELGQARPVGTFWQQPVPFGNISNAILTAAQSGWTEVTTTFNSVQYDKSIFCYVNDGELESIPDWNDEPGLGEFRSITENTSYEATLTEYDEDYLRFSLNEARTINIGWLPMDNRYDIMVEIQDSAGNTVADDISIEGEALTFHLTLPPGDYFIYVIGDIFSGEAHSYALSYTTNIAPVAVNPALITDTPATAAIGSLADEILFTFSLASPQAIKILLTPKNSLTTFRMELKRADTSQTIATIDSAGPTPFWLEALADAGDYTVRVTALEAADRNNSFTITLQNSSLQLETEPNNNTTEATKWDIDHAINGRLTNEEDVDFFSFELTAPAFKSLSFTSPGSMEYFTFSLYKDSEKNKIYTFFSSTETTVNYPVGLTKGHYFIKVEPGNNAETVAHYTLSLTDAAPATDTILHRISELESNNSRAVAIPIPPRDEGFSPDPKYGKAIEGRISFAEDVDYYSFYVDNETRLEVNFSANYQRGDYVVSILNDGGTLLQESFIYSGGSDTLYTDLNPGNYYIKIEGGDIVDTLANYLFFISVTEPAVIADIKEITGIIITGGQQIMAVDEQVDFGAVAVYSNAMPAPPQDFQWESSNKAVATIDINGLVTAHASGTSSIIVSLNDVTTKFDISVGDQPHVWNQRHGNLIVVAGGGNDPNDGLFESTQYLADQVYSRFQARFFKNEDIHYINPVEYHDIDKDGLDNDIVDDLSPTVTEFGQTITQWAVEQNTDGPLYIYLLDHGGIDTFKIFPGEILTAEQLKSYVDFFQQETGRQVIVMIEACKSGSFTDNIINHSEDRVIVTSSDNRDAYIELGGIISFTQFFTDKLLTGETIREAYNLAKAQLGSMGQPYSIMEPQIALGIGSTVDQTIVGGDFGIGSLFPEFGSISASITWPAYSAHTFQADIVDPSQVDKVWAVVKSPAYIPPAISADFAIPDVQQETFSYSFKTAESRYEGTYDNLTYNGDYTIQTYAMNSNGNVGLAPPVTITITDGAPPNLPVSGDLNGDGSTNLQDAIIGMQIISGMGASSIRLDYDSAGVDVNFDYQVGMPEIIYILGVSSN